MSDDTIGGAIRYQRVRHSLAICEVARGARLDPHRLNEIEWGRGKQPTLEELHHIFLALNVLSGRWPSQVEVSHHPGSSGS